MLVDLIKMIEDGKISTKQSKEILVKISKKNLVILTKWLLNLIIL